MADLIRDPFAIVYLLTIVVILPTYSLLDYRRMLRELAKGKSGARLAAYRQTIGVQWALTILFSAWWLLSGRDLPATSPVAAGAGWRWTALAVGLAVCAYLVFQMRSVLGDRGQLEKVRRQAGELCAIAPVTPSERRAFDLVSVTAGICEEILYRGLLIALLATALEPWPAIVTAVAVFGLGHAYQGWAGIGKTGAVGFVLALFYVGSGSLLVPMLIHAVIDLTSGRMLGAAAAPAPRAGR